MRDSSLLNEANEIRSGFQCYCFSEADYVIAEDVEDAWKVWCECTAEKREDYECECIPGCGCNPEELAPDQEISIWCDSKGEPDEPGNGALLLKHTAAFWIAKMGRGFLCSSEW
jgi:hypothetical protein